MQGYITTSNEQIISANLIYIALIYYKVSLWFIPYNISFATKLTRIYHYNLYPFLDPYAELEGQELYLSTDVLSSVKRSSSYTQVSDHRNYSFQPKFVQRRHSLTSINGKGSPIEVCSNKIQSCGIDILRQ